MGDDSAGNARLDAGTRLAVHRTFLAHERTLMAWVRTSTSLITFGFTIYKFFEYLVEENIGRIERQSFGPRQFAIGMISIGVVVLAAATVQYWHTLKSLELEYGQTFPSLASKLAALISIMGGVALIAVLFRQ